MTFREMHDKYMESLDSIQRSGFPKKGSARDSAMMLISQFPILAYDNHGYSYPVLVCPSEYRDGAPVLHFVGAPSGWFLSDLRDSKAPTIWLDMGQNWFCNNFDEIMLELKSKGAC